MLTGRGDGRFDVSWSAVAGENPVDLAIADLYSDGLADRAVANHEADYVTLLFGIAGGGFERRGHSRLPVNVSPRPHAVRLQDVDSDGHADLLVDDRSPESIRPFRALADGILVADEDGGSRPRATLPAPFGSFSVVAADLNGDGRQDVAAASGEGAGSLVTWHGFADGSFRAAGRYEIASGPTKCAAGDLTGERQRGGVGRELLCWTGSMRSARQGLGSSVAHDASHARGLGGRKSSRCFQSSPTSLFSLVQRIGIRPKWESLSMQPTQANKLLGDILREIADATGAARVNDYRGLRQVDAKTREARMIIRSLPGIGESLARDMDEDSDFSMNSRRVRLEALAGYCRTALRLLAAGAVQTAGRKPTIVRAPASMARLTTVMPDLQGVIEYRWLEAQKCQYAGAYLAAVVMMGSILEALLLARAMISPQDAYRSSAATQTQLQKWSLDRLINVSAECGWIKSDRKEFRTCATRFSKRGSPVASCREQGQLRQVDLHAVLADPSRVG